MRSPWSDRTPATTATTAGSSSGHRPGRAAAGRGRDGRAGDQQHLRAAPLDARGTVVLEVPDADDVLPLVAPRASRSAGCPGRRRVRQPVGARRHRGGGELLTPGASSSAQPVPDVDLDTEILWEVPDEVASVPLYAWLAGEAGVIRTLRRHLVAERGLDRRAVAFMGYWRLGHVDAD
ncbi:SIP domain-containing protein [Micromonospora sp. M12]